jgi:glucose 1-dehydrogenase
MTTPPPTDPAAPAAEDLQRRPEIAYQAVLEGQPALVTGANSGIGRAVALGLARAGADVAINYVADPQAADDVAHEIVGMGRKAITVAADVSKEDDVARMYDAAVKAFGTLHIVVANAGLQRDAPFEQMTLEQWNTVIGVNLTGQFLTTRAAVREFLRRGLDTAVSAAAGKIVCMSSVHQQIPWAGHVNYAASKGGSTC